MNIAIDIGATNLRIVSLETDKVIQRIDELTLKGKDNLTSQLLRLIDKLKGNKNIEKIAISICGPVNPSSNFIYALPNLEVVDYDLEKILKEKYNSEVKIINDANAAAYYEALVGNGKNYQKVLFITISSGIGAGLIIDKKIYAGHRGFALEVGKIFHDERTLESTCSGPGLLKRIKNRFSDLPSYFKYLKDNKSDETYLNWIDDLGKGISSIMNIIDPDILIFGGGLFKSKEIFFDDLKKSITSKLVYIPTREIIIEIASDDQNVALLGTILALSTKDVYY